MRKYIVNFHYTDKNGKEIHGIHEYNTDKDYVNSVINKCKESIRERTGVFTVVIDKITCNGKNV